jgi:EAL domain-containing protein (putative c-di-GMP-specific phosphodiesterase class I)
VAQSPEHFELHPTPLLAEGIVADDMMPPNSVLNGMTWAHDVIVIGSILISSMAINVLARSQFGMPSEHAALLAVTVIALACAAHILVRRRVEPTTTKSKSMGTQNSDLPPAPSVKQPAASATQASHTHAKQLHNHLQTPIAASAAAAATAIEQSDPDDEQTRIANLQALITELARTVPGPRATTPDPDATQIPKQNATLAPAASIDFQFSALTSAASAMRNAIAPQQSFATEIADCLASNRISTYLQPIQPLGQKQPQHYELSIRLRDNEGRELPHDEVKEEARHYGMLPLLDAALLPRAARVATHLHNRGRRSDILSPINAISITDADFQSGLDVALATAPASTIVLSFSQNEVRHFVPAHWSALSAMAHLGCRFAIEDVFDLDLDFETLKQYGFDFVKLDAEVLLAGLPSPSGLISPDDLCRYLTTAGYAIIVGHIDDDMTCARVLGFGALFGQGQLFGGKRAVRADAINADAAAA